GHAAPIMLERLERNLDAGLRADELVGAGADRMLGEPLVTDLVDILLRDDEADRAGRAAVESHKIGPDLLQVKDDDPRIDDLDPRHLLLQHGRTGALVPV